MPFSAGSANDILARIIGSKMGEGGTYQVIVDKRPGSLAAQQPLNNITRTTVEALAAVFGGAFGRLGRPRPRKRSSEIPGDLVFVAANTPPPSAQRLPSNSATMASIIARTLAVWRRS